jgi:primosomal protein N'
VCSAERSARAHAAAQAVRDALEGSPGSVLGPAALFRLRGRERQVLVIKAPPEHRSAVIAKVGTAVRHVAASRAYKSVAFGVDVDPQ